jgi:hypothetical protein
MSGKANQFEQIEGSQNTESEDSTRDRFIQDVAASSSDLRMPSGSGSGLDLPSISVGNDRGERTTALSYTDPMAVAAENMLGERPYKNSTLLANVDNPGRVAQADFVSQVLAARGFPEDIASGSGHLLSAKMDERSDLFEKIPIENRNLSELRPGDIVFGFRSPTPGYGHSQVGIVGKDGDIVWADSNKDGLISKVSQDQFTRSPSLRSFVAYRSFLGA